MKKTLLMILPLLWIVTAAGQGTPCWYDSLRLRSFDSSSKLKQDENLFYYRLNKWREKNTIQYYPKQMYVPCSSCLTIDPTGFKAKYIIPVVVHIIHRPSDPSPGDSSNITDGQVKDQIANLNRYFAGYDNSDPRSVNTGIQFCLAQIGPGNEGIFRVSNSMSNHNPTYDNMKDLMGLKDNSLPYSDYLHIYVVNEITDVSGSPSDIQGYATFPGVEPQGIVIRYKRFGNSTTCSGCSLDNVSQGKVLVHEVGHFLGVQHTFEGGCAGVTSATCADSGDKCCDVPPVASANSGCSPTPLNSCWENPPQNDMIENYMDYTNELCQSIFTRNQAEIMHYTLQTLRSWLVDPRHINEVPLSCESFSARYSGTNTVMCDRDSVRFTALKYSNMSPTYYWKISSGSTIIHLDSTTSFKYSWLPPSGFSKYTVMLKVRVDADTIADTIVDFVQVIDCGGPIRSSQGTWYFGNHAGIKFMNNAVIPENNAYLRAPSNINAGEGCISVCDTFGRLLFYGGARNYGNGDDDPSANLMELFDKNHNKVTTDKFSNPLELYAHGSCTQSGVVFPNPTDTSKFYLVTNQTAYEFIIYNGLSVYMIEKDSTNNITVTPTNDTINIASGEGLLAIPSCNNTWWLLFNTSDERIAVYEFDDSGKHFRYVTDRYPMNEQGYLKSSPDGRFVGKDGQLFKFNTQTGLLTHWLNFADTFYLGTSPYLLQIYGSSFSPNSEVYYYLEDAEDLNGKLWQLDLSKSDPVAHRQKVTEFPEQFIKALQLGPDGKLYLSMEGETQLAVLNSPDKVCSPSNPNACDYTESGPYIQVGGIGGVSQIGLPNMIDTRPPERIVKDIKIVQLECDSVLFSSSICCASIYEWDFGDLSPKVYNRETVHRYSGNGTYTVSLRIDSTYTITKLVKIGIEHNEILGKRDICDTISSVTFSADKLIVHSYEYNWECDNGSVTSLLSTPNFAKVKWHGNGKLKLDITDTKSGCKSVDSISVSVRPPIANNIITAFPTQTPCKASKDSIGGTIPTNVGMKFKYGWILDSSGINPYLIQGENNRYILPKTGINASYRRVIYDEDYGCYHESNKVDIINVKNEIGGKIGKCGGLVSGSNMALYGSVIYSWWESSDTFKTDSSLISGATNYYKTFSNTPSPTWARRMAINGACTTLSNIVRLDDSVIFEKDLPERQYICGNGNLAIEIIFEFWTGLEDIVTGESNQYYKIAIGTTDTTSINSNVHANIFSDGDTVFCIQTVPACGTFISRKCVIRKSFNYIHFTTHPSSGTLSEGSSKTFFAVLDNPTGVRWNWQVSSDNSNWQDIPSSTDNDSFTITNLNRCQNGRYYRVQAITGCGTTNSNGALLTVTGLSTYNQDYWLKDHGRDSGIERNPDSAYMVESADLWVRNQPDNIKPKDMKDNQMIAEGDNYIYYTVRNRGTDPAIGGKLYLYWTWAGTGEQWPIKWKYSSENMFPSPYTGVLHPMGSEITVSPIDLPTIASGDSIRNYVKWEYNVPKPTWFLTSHPSSVSIYPAANICLLARIQTCEEPDFGLSFRENNNLHYNVIGNNNIATRNSWMRFISKPKNVDFVKLINGGNEATDVGTTIVGSIHDIPTNYRLNISTIDPTLLTKVNLYIEMSEELEDLWTMQGSHSSGLSWVQDNVYRVTSSNASIDSLIFDPGVFGTIRTYVSYKDPDDRFENGEIFPVSISQFQFSGNIKTGEVRIELTDNPMPSPSIRTETFLSACNWDEMSTSYAKYVHTDPLSYTIRDSTNSTWVSNQPGGIYYLEPGTYLITSVDDISNTVYENLLTVTLSGITPVNSIDTVWYDCEYPDSVDYIKSCENGVMYDMFDQVVSESSLGHYTLDPQEPWYTFVCADSSNCIRYSIQIKFMDIIQIPSSTSNYLTGMYNREENPCCFIDLTEAECDGETPLTFGQEIQVYDMNADFLYQTNLELYGGTVLGFRFCPPQWDTTANVISNWYSIVIRNDECSFCRMDFMCDSIGDPEPFVILNFPSGRQTGGLGQSDRKSSVKGVVSGTEKLETGKLPTSISVYPNPAGSEVNVKVISANTSNLTIQINDAAGRPVYSGTYATLNNSLSTRIDLSELASGIYTIYVPELNYYYKLVLIK